MIISTLRFVCLTLLLFPVMGYSQHTFSIVAVDTVTGEVGSAGATCLDLTNTTSGALIISDILPGKGAIHTQAAWNGVNQSNARIRMEAGDSPAQIISWLQANDAGGFGQDSSRRQYGIVDFDSVGSPRAAAYTGVNAFDFKDHIVGPNYAIQGNILLGPQILTAMESGFLNTPGTLADKLMAAMQGANVAGADSRCLSEGVSSLSAFLRVSKPYDQPNQFYLDLRVLQTPFGVEPIDSLQTAYDNWNPPACNFPIPADAIVVNEPATTTGNNDTYWVCTGDTLFVSTSTNEVFLEPGAVLISQPGGGITTAYVKDSSIFNGEGTAFNTIYIGAGSVIADPGLAVMSVSCDSSVQFDYSMAPVGGCNATTGLNESAFAATNWHVYGDLQRSQLLITYSGSTPLPVEIQLVDLAGKIILSGSYKLEPGQQKRLTVPDITPGIYLVMIGDTDERYAARVLFR